MTLLTDDQIAQTVTTSIERRCITVTLVAAIPEAACKALNLSYRDPASIDVAEWQASTDPKLLVVPRAGEYLYRLQSK